MKSIFRVLSLLLMANAVLTSCLNSDDGDVTLHDDAAITAFTLGTVNRYQYVARRSTGVMDSLVKTTYTGSNYPMSIDQIGCRIFNQDSLPYGCDAAHIICSVTMKNGGGLAIQNLNDDDWSWFSTKDSIDLSQPRKLRVFSSDGTYQRDYTAWVNVAKTKNNAEAEWGLTADTPLLAGLAGMKVVALNGKPVVFGEKDGQTVAVASADGTQWNQLSSNVNEIFQSDAWQQVVVKGDYVYMLNGQSLFRSQDAEQWQAVASCPDLRQLVAAGTKELFAIGTDGLMKVSTDDGQTWTDEQTDEPATLLPTQGIASVSFDYAPSDSTDYVLLMGNDGEKTCVWHKISQYGGLSKGGQWVRMASAAGRFELPLHQRLSLAQYKGTLLAAGNGVSTVYMSRDQGLTWLSASAYTLPSAAKGDWLTMTADKDGTLWAVTNAGQVWMGGIK